MPHPWFRASDAPRVLAHRGFVPPGAGQITENSAAAVAAAHALGAAFVESDCHLSADGVVVLFHDADLRRVTGDPRAVADVTARELGDLMATRGGLLTLEDALDGFPTLHFNLDVKAEAAAEQTGRLVARSADRVLLTSFSDARRRTALDAARAAGGAPATSAGTGTILRAWAAANAGLMRTAVRLLADVDAIQIPERRGPLRVLSGRLLEAAHRAATEVHVWTVNDPDDMRRLLAVGVDGLVTDRCDLALQITAVDAGAQGGGTPVRRRCDRARTSR